MRIGILLFMMVSVVHAQQKDSGGKNSKGVDVDALPSQPRGSKQGIFSKRDDSVVFRIAPEGNVVKLTLSGL